MAIGDLYIARTHVRTAEGVMQFSFGYLMDAGTYTAVTGVKAALHFAQTKLDKYVLAVSDQVEVDKVHFDCVTNFVDIPGFVNFDNLEGALVGDALPNSSAAVLKLVTTAPNSKHNGRMYIPGVREGDADDGVLDAPTQALINTFGTVLELDLAAIPTETAEFTPVVISRFLDGIKRVPPLGFNLLSAVVDPNMKQQRRRGGRRFGLAT